MACELRTMYDLGGAVFLFETSLLLTHPYQCHISAITLDNPFSGVYDRPAYVKSMV